MVTVVTAPINAPRSTKPKKNKWWIEVAEAPKSDSDNDDEQAHGSQ